MDKARADVCRDLIVYTDWGHTSTSDHKSIQGCECKAEKEHRPCPRRGVCIEATDQETYRRVTSKTFTK